MRQFLQFPEGDIYSVELYLPAAVFFFAVAFVAALVPALRATRIDPVEAFAASRRNEDGPSVVSRRTNVERSGGCGSRVRAQIHGEGAMRHRGFTVVAILSLALAIGLNTTMYSVLDTLVNPHTDVPHPERLSGSVTSATCGTSSTCGRRTRSFGPALEPFGELSGRWPGEWRALIESPAPTRTAMSCHGRTELLRDDRRASR